MRTLVVLALLGSAVALPFLQDTPEVVAERQRFQQLFNAQAAAAAAAPDDPTHGGARYHQAPARNQWSAQPSQQWNAPSHQYTPQHHNTIQGVAQKWTGPVAATVPAGVDGTITPVSDTADVAAARAAFLNTYNAALTATRPAAGTQTWSAAPQQTWSAAPQQTWSAAPQQSWAPAPQPQARWTGPVAATIPAGLPGAGAQVGQTADVAAATAAFQQAYSAAVAATTGRRY